MRLTRKEVEAAALGTAEVQSSSCRLAEVERDWERARHPAHRVGSRWPLRPIGFQAQGGESGCGPGVTTPRSWAWGAGPLHRSAQGNRLRALGLTNSGGHRTPNRPCPHMFPAIISAIDGTRLQELRARRNRALGRRDCLDLLVRSGMPRQQRRHR